MSEDDREHVQDEYGAQFHGLLPHNVYGTVTDIMKQTVDEGVYSLVEKLKRLLPDCDYEAADSLLKTEFYAGVDKQGPKLLEAIRVALHIPQNSILPEDSVQLKQYEEEELNDLQNKTLELLRRVHYNNELKKVLMAETKIVESLEAMESKVASWQKVLERNLTESDDAMNEMKLSLHEGILNDAPKRTLVIENDEEV